MEIKLRYFLRSPPLFKVNRWSAPAIVVEVWPLIVSCRRSLCKPGTLRSACVRWGLRCRPCGSCCWGGGGCLSGGSLCCSSRGCGSSGCFSCGGSFGRLSDLTSVALKMSADGVPRQPDGPWSTLEQDLGEGKSNLDLGVDCGAIGSGIDDRATSLHFHFSQHIHFITFPKSHPKKSIHMYLFVKQTSSSSPLQRTQR